MKNTIMRNATIAMGAAGSLTLLALTPAHATGIWPSFPMGSTTRRRMSHLSHPGRRLRGASGTLKTVNCATSVRVSCSQG
jgi:hypothetical protein